MLALLLTLLLAVNTPAGPPPRKVPPAQPKLLMPLVLTVSQSVGMAPLTLRLKVRADTNQREFCVVVDGPEYQKSCMTPRGVTVTLDFVLRAGGEYAVFAVSDTYRTPAVTVRVIGLGEGS